MNICWMITQLANSYYFDESKEYTIKPLINNQWKTIGES